MSTEAWLVSRAFEAGWYWACRSAVHSNSYCGWKGARRGCQPALRILSLGFLQNPIFKSFGFMAKNLWAHQVGATGRSAGQQGDLGTLELAFQLLLLLFGSLHKKAPAPPSHAVPPTPTPAVGQMSYYLLLVAKAGKGLKFGGWPFKWLVALPHSGIQTPNHIPS